MCPYGRLYPKIEIGRGGGEGQGQWARQRQMETNTTAFPCFRSRRVRAKRVTRRRKEHGQTERALVGADTIASSDDLSLLLNSSFVTI